MTVCVTVGVAVTVCVTVGVAVTVCVTVSVTVGVVGDGEAETVGLGVAEALVVGDAVAAVTGSQDSLPACVATWATATSAVALPAETEKMPQETEASKTPVADRVTTARRVRVIRIENALASAGQHRSKTNLLVGQRSRELERLPGWLHYAL